MRGLAMCGPWLLPATASSTACGVSFPSTGGTEMILWPVASIAPVSRIAICPDAGEMIASWGRRTAAQMIRLARVPPPTKWTGTSTRPASFGDQAPRFNGCTHRCRRRSAASYSTCQQMQDLWVATLAVIIEKAVCRHRSESRRSPVVYATETSVWSEPEMGTEPILDVHRVSRRERSWRVLARDLQHVQTRTCCGFGQRGAS